MCVGRRIEGHLEDSQATPHHAVVQRHCTTSLAKCLHLLPCLPTVVWVWVCKGRGNLRVIFWLEESFLDQMMPISAPPHTHSCSKTKTSRDVFEDDTTCPYALSHWREKSKTVLVLSLPHLSFDLLLCNCQEGRRKSWKWSKVVETIWSVCISV